MSDGNFDSNNRDAAVVEEICGYLTTDPATSFFLFAGAGSGKTRTLVEVLRRLTGVEPHADGAELARRLRARRQAIRVVTYTRNAVSVILGRLGENPLVRVSTIHGFCWDLISGFDDDIRDALLTLNTAAVLSAQRKANRKKRGPTEKDEQIIEDLRSKAETLRRTHRFIYSPDRNTFGEGALLHDQVLSVASLLLETSPTLRRVLSDAHPIVLIDESQDTMKKMLSSLMKANDESPDSLAIGFLGDHRQRVYLDGHANLPGIIPNTWRRPKLQMNHRSQRRVVELINKIWEADIKGRTKSDLGIAQLPRSEKAGGTVRIFIGETGVASDEKIMREQLCAQTMANLTGVGEWSKANAGYQVLALEHTLVARRGGFFNAFAALSLIDEKASRPQTHMASEGPAATRVLFKQLAALEACWGKDSEIDEFAVMGVLHEHGSLENFPTCPIDQQSRLAELNECIHDVRAACLMPEPTVRDVIAPIIRYRLFELDDRLLRAFDEDPSPNPPADKSRKSKVDAQRRGWQDLFNVKWSELSRYRSYLAGTSNLSTHQVVKGSEFPHVMVVMDDSEAGGHLFSYDKLFGAKALSVNDLANFDDEKETTIDRTLRLLYVTCSRAQESLALILWSADPKLAKEKILKSGWFSPDEVAEVPAPS